MKLYTNKDQTAKLIELGYFRPALSWKPPFGGRDEIIHNPFSIGELIEMLAGVSELEIIRYGSGWEVGDELRAFTSEELIDAIYDMIVKLKEVGVI